MTFRNSTTNSNQLRGDQMNWESNAGGYGQGEYDQDDRWRSHRGDWGQGRIDYRGDRGEDQYGDYSDGSRGGDGDQRYAGQGFSERGSGHQRQMSGQGDWGVSRQGGSQQGYGSQGNYRGGQRGPSTASTYTYTEVWLIPGPHTGRGPRGYQRSGQRIEEDVCERLSQHGHLDASDIEVKVENSEVTLTGTVASRQEKRMAEDALDSVSGIEDVHNQLRIKKSAQDHDQGASESRTENGRDRQGRSGKESSSTSRTKESAKAGAD